MPFGFIVAHCCPEDGERTLIDEKTYFKVFLMRMPIMVRTFQSFALHSMCNMVQEESGAFDKCVDMYWYTTGILHNHYIIYIHTYTVITCNHYIIHNNAKHTSSSMYTVNVCNVKQVMVWLCYVMLRYVYIYIHNSLVQFMCVVECTGMGCNVV